MDIGDGHTNKVSFAERTRIGKIELSLFEAGQRQLLDDLRREGDRLIVESLASMAPVYPQHFDTSGHTLISPVPDPSRMGC